jgi:hypothetical protein
MNSTPVPIALRAFTLRSVIEDVPAPKAPNPSARAAQKPPRLRPTQPAWPGRLLVFDTETTTDASQRLLFGCYRVLRWLSGGVLVLIQEGLFHADDLASWDPAGLRELQEYAASAGVRLCTRREFIDEVFYPIAVEVKGMVVGFNLPFDIARIAVESGEARGRYHGGFSFALAEYFDKATGEYIEDPYRARVCIKSLDSKRAFIGFARPIRTAESRPETFRGHFLDLRTLAHTLSGESHTLSSACKAFGVEHGKAQTEEYGRISRDFVAYARRDVLATQELLERLRVEFDQLGVPLLPTKAFSPASIAKAAMRGMGVIPLHKKAPTITAAEIGRTFTAFYGGRAECRHRRVSLPVVTVDFRSMYPTVNCLMGLWKLVIAESVRFEDYTEELRALLADATLTNALSRELWPKLAGFAEIEPDGDILPVRAQYSNTRDGWNIGVNYLTSPLPFTYAVADVYASTLLAGKPLRIRRAWRLVGDGLQTGLCPISLGGTIPVDPRSGDFFRTLIEERVHIKNSNEHTPETRARVALLLKLIANSGGYGIFAELNREELPVDKVADITVFGHGEPYERTTSTPEDMGAFCFPPLAALISAAARLMLAILERCVTDRGGSYAFCDTDSMAIVATETGGLIECEGGTADATDRIEAIRALAWRDVEDIRAQFHTLNPYNVCFIPSILNIEDVNFASGAQREIMAHVISAKRYALFSYDESGAIQLEKCSEHGLGQLMSPIPKDGDEKWPDVLWKLILAEEHAIRHAIPAWLKFPAVARVSVSTPGYFRGFLRRFNAMPYAKRVKPFGFLLHCTVSRFGHPKGTDPKSFHLLAPYSTDAKQWGSQLWADAYSGAEFGVVNGPSYLPGIVSVRSLADIKAEFLAHGESKSEASDGEPADARARGVLQRRHVAPANFVSLGKESNHLDEIAAGLHGDWREILADYESKKSRPSSDVLRSVPATLIAETWNVSVRTVRNWRRRILKPT